MSLTEMNVRQPHQNPHQSGLKMQSWVVVGEVENPKSAWSVAYWTWKFIRKQGRYDRQGTNETINRAFPTVPWKVNAHINVTSDKSVFDGDLTYWAKRENKNYSGIHASILKQQNHKCNACGLTFFKGDKVELHHIDGNHDNWKRSNLEMLHRHCHQHKPVHGLVRVARNLSQNIT